MDCFFLPPEVIRKILSRVEPKEIYKYLRVSKLFRFLIETIHNYRYFRQDPPLGYEEKEYRKDVWKNPYLFKFSAFIRDLNDYNQKVKNKRKKKVLCNKLKDRQDEIYNLLKNIESYQRDIYLLKSKNQVRNIVDDSHAIYNGYDYPDIMVNRFY